jgi:hypothetical protein
MRGAYGDSGLALHRASRQAVRLPLNVRLGRRARRLPLDGAVAGGLQSSLVVAKARRFAAPSPHTRPRDCLPHLRRGALRRVAQRSPLRYGFISACG